MAIKITDNLMARPLEPGSGVRGLDVAPERVFGNTVARPSGALNVVQGYAGASNRAAGAEGEAASRAISAIGASVADTAQYFDKLKIAEEDSRASAAEFDIRVKEQELRKKLGEQATAEGWSTDEYSTRYNDSLQATRDEVFGSLGLSHKQVIDAYDKRWKEQSFELRSNFDEREIKPRRVAAVAESSQKIADAITAKAVSDGTVESVSKGIEEITAHFSKPEVVAVLGPQAALAAKTSTIATMSKLVADNKIDALSDLHKGPLAGLTGDAINDTAIRGDALGQARYFIDSLPLSPADKENLRDRAEAQINQGFAQKTTQIVQADNAARRAQEEDRKLTLQETGNTLKALSAEGKLTRVNLQQTINVLANSANFKDNREARADLETLRVSLLDDLKRQEKAHAAERAARSAGIGMADQASTDKGWKAFSNANFGGKNFNELSPEQQQKAFAWLKQNNPVKLPAGMKNGIYTGMMSQDKAQATAALAQYNTLLREMPLLLDDIPKEARNLAGRMNEGQSWERARDATFAERQMTPEQIEVAKDAGREWMKSNVKSPDDHPGLKATGAKILTPAAQSFWQREFDDEVRAGTPPATAAKVASARLGKSFGSSELLQYDGKPTAALAAPEKVFNAPASVIREDVIASGKDFGFTKDTKFKLQPIPNGRDSQGRQTYGVMVEQQDGSSRIATDAQGRPFKYTFDSTSNPAAQRKLAEHRNDDQVANYNRLMANAVKTGQVKIKSVGGTATPYLLYGKFTKDPKASPNFNADLWAQAGKQLDD